MTLQGCNLIFAIRDVTVMRRTHLLFRLASYSRNMVASSLVHFVLQAKGTYRVLWQCS